MLKFLVRSLAGIVCCGLLTGAMSAAVRSAETVSTGASWRPIRIGAGGWLVGLDIAPDGTKVVRTDTYGAYLWDSSKTQWKQLVTTLSMPPEEIGVLRNDGVYEIRIAPSSTNRFYMIYRGILYRSDNKGDTWQKTSLSHLVAAANTNFRMNGPKMAVDPSNPDIVVAGSDSTGLWQTSDGGSTWNKIDTVPDPQPQAGYTGIAFDPKTGVADSKAQTIYVCSWGNGVYRSVDSGLTWTKTDGGPTNVQHGVVGTDGGYYAVDGAAFWKYTNGTWSSVLPGSFHAIAIDPKNAAHIVLGGDGGSVTQSPDNGKSWLGSYAPSRISPQIGWLSWTKETYMSNGDMAFDPVLPDRLYFAEGIGVWYTSPSKIGKSVEWTALDEGIEQLVANEIIVPPGGKPILASWDRPVFYVDDPNIYPSTHGPDNQTAIVAGWSLDWASADPTFVVGLMNWWGVERSGYSRDGGKSWQPFSGYPAVLKDGKIAGSIAAATSRNYVWVPSNNSQPYFTKDGGSTWAPGTIEDPPTGNYSGWGWAYYLNRDIIAADRVNSGTFYAYNYLSGLYRSIDGGENWHIVKHGEISKWSGFSAKLRTVPGEAGHLFFTGGSQGTGNDPHPGDEPFERSKDGGVTWAPIPNVLEVHDFGFGKPASVGGYPAVIVVGWVNRVYGVWVSNDDCATWQMLGEYPLDSLDAIRTIQGDPNVYGRVYVGFAGSGYAYGDFSGSQ